MIFFTTDEHYSHSSVITYSNRPFSSVDEMKEILIQNNNKVVKPKDTVIHAGDFTFEKNLDVVENLIKCLIGRHIFISGSHDYWQKTYSKKHNIHFADIKEIRFNKSLIVACHHPMLTWPRSHYGSWHVHGHHHGRLQNNGKSWDAGVDNNLYTPVSFDQLVAIMEERPENINYIPEENRRQRK